jgi:CheY-like chemotaxis protein
VARILIVEPHADIRSLLELVVRRLGHDAIAYDGGDPASLRPDAAVIEPGEGGGLHLARRLRRLGIPVLFTSIFPADHQALELEPSAYLVKPFPLYALERALADALAPVEAHAAAV